MRCGERRAEDADKVGVPDTQAHQIVRETIGAAVELGIGDVLVAEDQRRRASGVSAASRATVRCTGVNDEPVVSPARFH